MLTPRERALLEDAAAIIASCTRSLTGLERLLRDYALPQQEGDEQEDEARPAPRRGSSSSLRLVPASDTAEWREFLAQHPELRPSDGRRLKTAPRLDFGSIDDKALLSAMESARAQRNAWLSAVPIAEWEGRTCDWVSADDVARVLAGEREFHRTVRVAHGDVVKAGQRLARLARAGRIGRDAGAGIYWPISEADPSA